MDDMLAVVSQTAHGLEKAYDRFAAAGPARPLPDRRILVELLDETTTLLFPLQQHACRGPELQQRLQRLYMGLSHEMHHAVAHRCDEWSTCAVMAWAREETARWIAGLVEIREMLEDDLQAAYEGDPATVGLDEIALTYPGFYAVTIYRLAHALYERNVPLLPRTMTEIAHSRTGIDIHPGAQIGRAFFIDHGTGVVIGATCVIGDRVKLYQGVTLGALSFPRDEVGALIRGTKRHPTIEENVTIYAGATILGGETVVGHDSVIGGNVWLTESVPPYTRVLNRANIEVRT